MKPFYKYPNLFQFLRLRAWGLNCFLSAVGIWFIMTVCLRKCAALHLWRPCCSVTLTLDRAIHRLATISFCSQCTTWRLTSWPLHCQWAARPRVTHHAGEEWRKMASDALRKSVHSFLFTPTLLILITPLVFLSFLSCSPTWQWKIMQLS